MLPLLFIILGLVFGSFISALSYRNPKNISVAHGRSFCDKCRTQLFWYDNIPVFSYIFLGGRCRNCKKQISFRYPLIEITSAISFYVIYKLLFPDIWGVISLLTVFVIVFSIFVIDWEKKIIPDNLTFLGIVLTTFYFLFTSYDSLFPRIFAGLVAASFLLSLHLITKGRGMGLGDVKFAILGGMLMGTRQTFLWLLLAFLTGAMVGIILILVRGARLKDQIAFGPFLVASLGITALFGENILRFIGLK